MLVGIRAHRSLRSARTGNVTRIISAGLRAYFLLFAVTVGKPHHGLFSQCVRSHEMNRLDEWASVTHSSHGPTALSPGRHKSGGRFDMSIQSEPVLSRVDRWHVEVSDDLRVGALVLKYVARPLDTASELRVSPTYALTYRQLRQLAWQLMELAERVERPSHTQHATD
jgi:hypothetical protein